MGFRIGAGFGPLYVSKSIGGGRRRKPKVPVPSLSGAMAQADRDLGDIARMRAAIDAMPREEIRRRHAFGWAVAVIFALMFAISLYGLPVSAVILGWTWWGHRQRWQRVAAREQQQAAARAEQESREAARQAARHLTPQDQEWLRRHDGRS